MKKGVTVKEAQSEVRTKNIREWSTETLIVMYWIMFKESLLHPEFEDYARSKRPDLEWQTIVDRAITDSKYLAKNDPNFGTHSLSFLKERINEIRTELKVRGVDIDGFSLMSRVYELYEWTATA